MPNQPSSYRKLFLHAEDVSDPIEKEILNRIQSDYEKFHKHDLIEFQNLLDNDNLVCPYCQSSSYKVHGYDKNKIKRYKCKKCERTFNCFSNSLFFSTKINLKAWLSYLECILSGTSIKAACLTAKISLPTGTEWMHKLFLVLKDYQNSISLNDSFYIDETYVHVDDSKTYYQNEIGKIKKVPKLPRGISRNKICILVATDMEKSFAEIVGTGRPSRIKNYEICLKHIHKNSLMIGDEDTSLTYTANNLQLTRKQYKSNTEEAYKELEPVDQLCKRLKFFLDKHRGFEKEFLQDYINLFIYIDNERFNNPDLYITTKKTLKKLLIYKIHNENN